MTTLLYCTVQYCIVLYCTVLYYTVLYPGAGEQRAGGCAEGAAPHQQAGEEHPAGLRGGRGRGQGGGQGGPALQGTGDLLEVDYREKAANMAFFFVSSCDNKD